MTHRFNWDRSLDTGIEELDIQHQRFVTLINHLDHAQQTDPVLAELLRHLVFHFRCEQALMDAYEEDYAAMEEEVHVLEEEAVRSMVTRFRAGELPKVELCDQLYTFLLNHSVRDQALASAVIAKRASLES